MVVTSIWLCTIFCRCDYDIWIMQKYCSFTSWYGFYVSVTLPSTMVIFYMVLPSLSKNMGITSQKTFCTYRRFQDPLYTLWKKIRPSPSVCQVFIKSVKECLLAVVTPSMVYNAGQRHSKIPVICSGLWKRKLMPNYACISCEWMNDSTE